MTDGDALCYHLQVPKVFLMRGSVGFLPDLHETVYPLVTELLYALALEFRGPVACRGIQWFLGLVFAANVIALARPVLGSRAWWAGAIVLSVPAVSNGMTAPLNDVALAAFGTAAIFAWIRLHDRPSYARRDPGGLVRRPGDRGQVSGARLCAVCWRRRSCCAVLDRRPPSAAARPAAVGSPWRSSMSRRRSPSGGWWYLRAYVHTGNPVFPFFRDCLRRGRAGRGARPVQAAAAGRLRSTCSFRSCRSRSQPDRFDSFSHQFGPIFLLFLPALLLERAPRRVWSLAVLGYLFLTFA